MRLGIALCKNAAGVALCVGVACSALACGTDQTTDDGGAAGSAVATISRTVVASTSSANDVTGSPTTQVLPPPFVDHVVWEDTEVGPSLQIYPTASGRRTEEPTSMAQAWAEVLALAPNADTPGMKAQFDCHWNYARAIDPDKASWNIEPNRPVVSGQEMISARCNPGAAEE